MKTAKIFAVNFLLLSLALYMMSGFIVSAYLALTHTVGSFVVPATIISSYDSSNRVVPFLALMLATPGVKIDKKLGLSATGVLMFLLIDISGNVLWGGLPPQSVSGATSTSHYLYSLMWDLMGHWILPLLLWLVAVSDGGYMHIKGKAISDSTLTREVGRMNTCEFEKKKGR